MDFDENDAVESEKIRQSLTEEERKAIASFHRLAKKWPKSLWLYAASGTMRVMRKGDDGDGDHVWDRDFGSPDQNYVVDTVAIECDGGDF